MKRFAKMNRFITPLKGPDEEIAKDFLNRIAAKVVPIMKKHGMDVMSLEEFEPNKEFVGRSLHLKSFQPGELTTIETGMQAKT
jgi:hypothetical protein